MVWIVVHHTGGAASPFASNGLGAGAILLRVGSLIVIANNQSNGANAQRIGLAGEIAGLRATNPQRMPL